MKPKSLNRFKKKLTRERVVPIISASVSWLIFAIIGIGLDSWPKFASRSSSRFSLELKRWRCRSGYRKLHPPCPLARTRIHHFDIPGYSFRLPILSGSGVDRRQYSIRRRAEHRRALGHRAYLADRARLRDYAAVSSAHCRASALRSSSSARSQSSSPCPSDIPRWI